VIPPTLTAYYSTNSSRSTPVALEAATLPAGEVAVFFGPTGNTDITSFDIFCNHTGALPASGAGVDSFVRSTGTEPYDLLGQAGGLAIMWDTNVDPTGNARADYDPNGLTTFTSRANYIDATSSETTFTFNTANTPIGAAPTVDYRIVAYGNATTSTTISVPDGVDRCVVVQAHYVAGPFPSFSMILNSMTIGGTAMTELPAGTVDILQSTGLGTFTAYAPESALATGAMTITPTYSSTLTADSAIVYHIWIFTNVADPALAASSDFNNVSETTSSAPAPSLVGVAANSYLMTSASTQLPDETDPTVDIGTMGTTQGWPLGTINIESRGSLLADSGPSATETATWTTMGRAAGVLTSLAYTASGGGGGVTPIIPAVPVIGTITVADNQLTVPWAAATDAVSYQIRYSQGATPLVPNGSAILATSPKVITGLIASQSYAIQVRSKSSTDDYSAWSTAVYAVPTGTVLPPPTFNGKFLVSSDHRDVSMGEGYGIPYFNDLWMQKGFVRVNVGDEYGAHYIATGPILDRAIERYEARGSQALPFRDAAGPRLIVTNKLGWAGARQNSTAPASEKAAAIADMGKSGSTGTLNRDSTWLQLGTNMNATYRGYNVADIVFMSISHESFGSWAYQYAGRNPQLIGQAILTGATNAQYGATMGAAMRHAGETGDCSLVHKAATEHVYDLITQNCPNAIIGFTPNDGAGSDITGTAASALGSTWVRSAWPDRPLDFICPTMYARGDDVPTYVGSGDLDTWSSYDRSSGWLEYAQEYVNTIYGCAFGLLEFGGDFALPGQLSPGDFPSATDREMAAFYERMLEHELDATNYPVGLMCVNHWFFLNWEGSNGDPGCSFHPLEGIWGAHPANVVPTSTGKPAWSTQPSNTRYPKTLTYMQSQFAVR